MAGKDYVTLTVFFDQSYLEEITSAELATENGEQEVDLLKEGFGGFSPGSGRCTINLGFAVPKEGLEYPYQQKCADREWVAAQIGIGPEAFAGLGKITTCNISQSTNAATEGTCTWIGPLNPLQ
jgi:hypothetical protein